MYTEYRVFTELKYLNMFGCNAHPKYDNEIASVDAAVYQRVKNRIAEFIFDFDDLKPQSKQYLLLLLKKAK